MTFDRKCDFFACVENKSHFWLIHENPLCFCVLQSSIGFAERYFHDKVLSRTTYSSSTLLFLLK